METIKTATLAFCDIASGGTSDKVYVLHLEHCGGEYTVTAQFGRRGATMQVDRKTKTPVGESEADQIFDRVLRQKLAKGYAYTQNHVEAPAPLPAPTKREPSPATETPVPATGRDHGPLKQELLTEISEDEALRFIGDENYWMQDKSDGHARGAVKADGGYYGLNKLGKQVALPSEIVKELNRIPLDAFQIDAEIIGTKLVCRDLLSAGGENLSSEPYEIRFVRLVSVLDPSFEYVSAVETWAGSENKAAALARAKKERREGVVFKLRNAPHRGGRNGQHKKFKFIKTLSAIAGKPRAKGKDSVEIFLRDGKQTVRVGTVSLIGKTKITEGAVIEVAYLYAFPSKMLCQARMMSLRDDVTAKECTTGQLIFKREEA